MSSVSFQQAKADKKEVSHQAKKKDQKQYNDPLMKWPVRGMAFTNDIGAAISDIAPKAGALLWYPAMMYFGADIYDKYRNDKESYDPNAQRGFEQAVFQAFASVIFPIVAVHTGQKTASVLARHSKEKLSLQTQEESTQFLMDFMDRRKLKKYDGQKAKFKEEFQVSFDNYVESTTLKHQNKNVFRKFFDLIFSSKHPEVMGQVGKEGKQTLEKFLDKKIDNMFEIREALLNDETRRPDKLSEKLFTEFKNAKEKYLKDPDFKANAKELAIKDVLLNMESSNIFKTKMKKTIGGFIVLGALIKPIDMFVENVIMKKYVEPGLDYIQETSINSFKRKNMS